MNKGGLVQGDAHQLLEEWKASAWISAFRVLAPVNILFFCGGTRPVEEQAVLLVHHA